MIKKETKVIFENGEETQELTGGIPLSVGEVVRLHQKGGKAAVDYLVVKKDVDCFMEGDDQKVIILYRLRKKV
ncbi:MAG: hypothetical protein AAB871_04095 [Patescibacteria group bacterium]